MRERTYIFLAVILLVTIFTSWIGLTDPHIQFGPIDKQVKWHFGLDIQGGLRVLLESNLPPGVQATTDSISVAKTIIEQRVNAFGVSEPVIQIQGNRIALELAGLTNPDEAIATFGNTGQLEFVDAGDTPLTEGATVATTGPTPNNSCSQVLASGAAPTATTLPSPTLTLTPTATLAPTATITPSATISPSATLTPTTALTTTNPLTTTPPLTSTTVYTTVMTGDCLDGANVSFSTANAPYIAFTLKSNGAKIFGDFTSTHVQKYLAIALDKKIISSPVINSAITGGSGIIEGKFTLEEANNLAIQLKYGALPVPLKVVDTTTIGPTLGQDSVNKSAIAGIIGLTVVALFMLLNYRLPGLLADLALGIYTLVTVAIYKGGVPLLFDHITLTLPGIAGFVLSVGVAVDANILIFERVKEELRAGRPLTLAIEAGFSRAWPSIRDSNMSTAITCIILYWFGTTFAASIVAGFALTLLLGVILNIITGVYVTRTFLRLVIDLNVTRNPWWFGV